MYTKEKKNIVIIINSLNKGGAEKQAVVLANQLINFHHVSILVLANTSANNHLTIELHPKVKKIFYDNVLPKNILSIVRHEKIKDANVVISMLARSNIVAALCRFFNRKAKVFGGIRSCSLIKGKFYVELLLHKYFHDITIFNNHSGMQSLITKGFIEEKAICIHNALPTVPDKKENDKSKSGIIKIISLSRFVHQKDLHTAVNAIHYLVHGLKCNSFLYYMGGYGNEKKSLAELVHKTKMTSYIKIVENPDVHNFLFNGDIFINTSLFEGTSNSILEAMSYSLPVVATDAGDNKYLVKDSYNGFITEIGDYKVIAEKLKVLIENPMLRHKYGNNSYYRVMEKFNTENFRQKYLKLIDE